MSDLAFVLNDLKENTGNFDDEGGYKWYLIDGTKTKVYTKYLTGTLDNDSTTNIAHGIVDHNKILSASGIGEHSSNNYRVYDYKMTANITVAFSLFYDATDIVMNDLGSAIQGNNYRIKLEYTL